MYVMLGHEKEHKFNQTDFLKDRPRLFLDLWIREQTQRELFGSKCGIVQLLKSASNLETITQV